MHIPDGYLGPPTYVAAYLACAPLWAIASRKVRDSLTTRRIPLLAIAIPGMMLGHLLLFGVVEGVITGLVVRYLNRSASAWILRGVGGEATP